MKLYLISLAAGLIAGLGYSLLGVRSPAPPTVALIGLLGMLMGEQALPLARRVFAPGLAGIAAVSEGSSQGSPLATRNSDAFDGPA